jgi:hypothetical protein
MREVQITATLWVEDKDVDEKDNTGLTSRAFDEFIVPLMSMGLDDVETRLL